MKLGVLAAAFSLLVAGPALAQKVYVDYDPAYPGDTIETFAWDARAGESIKQYSELLHARIVKAIDHHLEAGGFREVDSDPDVHVTYHTSVEETVRLNTVDWGYFVPNGWYWGPYGSSAVFTYTGEKQSVTNAKTYESGTLIVDVWDAESKQLIWRGAASKITVSWNPNKIEKRLDKALDKIVARWKEIQQSAP